MTVIVACNATRGGDGLTEVVNGPQRPLTSLLRETSYASLTTKCITMAEICTVPNTSPRSSAFHYFSSVRLAHGDPGESYPFDTVTLVQNPV